MNKNVIGFLFLCVLSLCVAAQSQTFIDVQANKQLEIINKQFNNDSKDLVTLKQYENQLEQLQDSARQCSKEARAQLDALKKMLKKTESYGSK